MRLTIDHRTTYRFTEPQARLVQMLRVTPQNSHDQTVASWRIDVDCDARLREGCDGWGNVVTMLYAEGPIEGIEIAVSGEVLTSHSNGVLHGVVETLPSALYLRATPATPADAAIGDWAAAMAGDAEPLAALHRINAGLHERFDIDRGRPEPGLTAAQAWQREAATPRDLAQIFAVAARSIGAPARYVSGYSLIGGDHRPSPHGWAEAHVEEIGWIGFDPCTGLSPEEHHVRVAVALDAAGAAPVAGSRLGEGEERLDVDVSVAAGSSGRIDDRMQMGRRHLSREQVAREDAAKLAAFGAFERQALDECMGGIGWLVVLCRQRVLDDAQRLGDLATYLQDVSHGNLRQASIGTKLPPSPEYLPNNAEITRAITGEDAETTYR